MSKYKYDSLLCPGEKVTEEQLATDRNLLAFERSISVNRRSFMAGFAGLAALAVAATAAPGKAYGQSALPPITDVLNFALNLEYLECNLYLLASGQAALPASLGGNPATIMNAPGKIALTATVQALAVALATDELNHIATLRATITSLGGTPVNQPALNYGAKGAITTQAQFLTTARQFTAVGGSAYAGSAQLLVSNTAVLTAAAQILGAEGQHDGAVNYQCNVNGVVSPSVDALDFPPTSTNYFTLAPVTALAPERNTSQVLGIVYGVSTAATITPPAGVMLGGFFPAGFNGNVKST